MTQIPECTMEELLAVLISREVKDSEMSACGALSFIPAAGLLLASHTHAPHAEIIIQGSKEYFPFVGGPDWHNMASRGQMDLFFIGAIEIDRHANFNLHVIGDRDHPDVLMPGLYGSGLLYYTVPRIIFFRTEHTRRFLVEKVQFISAAGSAPEGVPRRNREVKIITPRAILRRNEETRFLELESVHPGHTLKEVLDNTGFDLGVKGKVPETSPVTADELHVLRTAVKKHMIETETYPELARTRIMVD